MARQNVGITKPLTFEWDKGNTGKNRLKHGVEPKECEEAFLNKPLIISKDIKHSQKEGRFQTLGQTSRKRLMFIAFTIRGEKIRVISARDQGKKERKIYQREMVKKHNLK